jgi:hypothetical protein
MSEQPADRPDSDPDEQTDAPPVGAGTDVDAGDLDVQDGAGGDTPATSDPEQFVDDATLGGTGGESAGGAG